MSNAGDLLQLVASTAAAVGGVTWGTAPEAVWFVDFASEELRARGLSALVVMPTAKIDFKTRGRVAGDEVEVHVAVFAPRGAGSFSVGDVVVDAAEKIAAAFVGLKVSDGSIAATFSEASLDPVISGDFMRQNNLWVSYLKLTLRVVF
jgi:hypothetical protein